MFLIGSDVSFNENQLLDSVKEAISYGASTFMIYTGSMISAKRDIINEELTKKSHLLMQENNIDINDIVCHAPYIINLANKSNMSKYTFGINF